MAHIFTANRWGQGTDAILCSAVLKYSINEQINVGIGDAIR